MGGIPSFGTTNAGEIPKPSGIAGLMPDFLCYKNAGYLRVPPAFETLSTEMFDRWEASAYLDYELWYDPAALQYFKLEGINETPQVLLVDYPR